MELYNKFILSLQSIGKPISKLKEFINNQQCVGETFIYFLEVFETIIPMIRLFKHRYNQEIICTNCSYNSVSKIVNVMFEVNPNNDLLKEIINIKEHIEDYKCEYCNTVNKIIKKNVLKMLPEILVFVVKNYTWCNNRGIKKNNISDFPEFLFINPLKYRAVAYIDHFGSLNSGHYIATCLRKDINGDICWYTFNDNNYHKTNYNPNQNTYIVIYSFMN
jgi:ubiquitin C-terminal hydrolase